MIDNELVEILQNVDIYNRLYEVIRLVDPVKKEVISYKNDVIESMPVKCFDFWGKDNICENCISIRAFINNKTYVKMEYNNDKSYLVMAIPYELSDRRIVIELLKDITDSIVLDARDNSLKSDILSIVDHLNTLILKDPLTGIYNRRYISEKLPVDIVNASLLDQPLSIIMFDIDFLKRINDTYGHQAGDIAIKESASCASDCLERKADWVARYGGEEFIIALPGADLGKTLEVAEKIRSKIEKEDFKYKDEIFRVTASFGVCNMVPSQKHTMEELIEIADKKLYQAKNNGRNRVEI